MSLTRKRRTQLIKEVGKMALEMIEEEVQPEWAEPVIILRRDGSLRVSLTHEDKFDRVVPWKKFAESVTTSDPDILEAALPKFEALVQEIKATLAQY